MRQKLAYTLNLLIFFAFFPASAVVGLNELAGRPIGTIYSIHQGTSGIWLGGENGLFYVSGDYTTFFGERRNSIFESDIEDLFEDADGRLWIATFGQGMNTFNMQENKFNPIKSPIDSISPYCRNVAGNSSFVVFSCGQQIFKYNLKSKLISQPFDLSDLQITDITSLLYVNENIYFIDNLSRLFVISDTNLIELDLNLEHLTSLYSMYIDDSNRLWVGTSVGVTILDLNNYQNISCLNSAKYNDITSIFAINKSEIWVYQYGFKRIIFNQKREVCESEVVNGLSQIKFNEIFDVELLNNDSFIFSTPIFGLLAYSQVHQSIIELPLIKNDFGAIEYAELRTKNLFIASNIGITLLDLESSKSSLISSHFGFVSDLLFLENGDFIISSDEQGMVYFKELENSEYEANTIKFDSLNGSISSIERLYNGNLILAVLGGQKPGLYEINMGGKVQFYIKNVIPDLLLTTKNKELYIASRFKGIEKLNLETRETVMQAANIGKFNFINNCLIEDTSGTIWLCTDGAGLAYLDELNEELVFVDPELTGGSRHIRELVEDTQGYLWVMTNQGLVRYDHKNKTSITLGKEDGIQDLDFEITASINLPDNQILVAGDTRNYIIDTKIANRYLDKRLLKKSDTVFVDLNVLIREEQGMQSKKLELYKSIENKSFLEFSYDEFLMTLKFAANNFIDRKVLDFEYRLLGFDPSWVGTTSRDSAATFSTLPTGEYEFQVRVVDPKSNATQPINTLKIRILPPFWQTWQAYTVYLIAIILGLVVFLKLRTIHLKKANSKLESDVQGRTVELATSENKIGKMLRHKESLFANASHEIRTPLSLINGPLEALSHLVNDEKASEYLDMAKRNSFRLSQLADQILELSKADSKNFDSKIEYNLFPSIENIVGAFKSIILSNQQQLVFENNASGYGYFLPDSLEKILSNLLNNASKYSPKNTEIYIKTSTVNNRLSIVIADQGTGIKEEDFDAIFERFNRLDNADNTEGAGLGLAVVKELVEANGGEIQVSSQLGEGSEFKLFLPMHEKLEDKKEAFISSANQMIKEKTSTHYPESIINVQQDDRDELPTILIVEDSSDMRSFISHFLSSDYKCETAKDGAEAYQKALELLPDLIVSDLMMPKLNGFEFTQRVRENELTCHIPIIMLTAKGDDNTRIESWSFHVDDFISKPFNNEELKARIANLIFIRRSISKALSDSFMDQKSNPFVLNNSEFYTERDKRFFDKFTTWIENNYADEKISRKHAADAMAVSERQLNRKLVALVEISFSELLRKFRLSKAHKLLAEGVQISLVAYETGFSSPSYFSSCFKEEFGVSPKAFVESLQDDKERK